MNETPRYRYASDKIENAVFYLPFAYLYRVRLGTPAKLLSWMLLYIFPTLFFSACLWEKSGTNMTLFLADYFLILIAVFGIYESGYIFNDTLSIRGERNPSIRLYPDNLQYFYMHLPHVFVVRGAVVLAALIGLCIINNNSTAIVITVGAVVAVAILFALYNNWRSAYNAFLYPFLVFSRYIVFLIPFFSSIENGFNDFDMLVVALLFLCFPLLNAIERFSMPRKRFAFIKRIIPEEESKTLFRVYYYGILLPVLFVVLYSTSSFAANMLCPFVLLAWHRIVVFAVTLRYTPKNYLQG